MIPKIIHYCWINKDENKPLPKEVLRCISTWKNILPDYEIKRWDASNFNVNTCDFTKEAFKAEKYAFVSDYMRLYALYKYGGIYLDTDVKVIKSFNDLLNNKAFCGFENEKLMGTSLIACEKKHVLIKNMLDLYENKHFIDDKGNIDDTPNTVLFTKIIINSGIKLKNANQKNEYISVFASDYFSPMNERTGNLNITNNTYSIHLFSGSWVSHKDKQKKELYKKVFSKYNKILPEFLADLIARFTVVYNLEGAKGVKTKLLNKLFK